MDETAYSPTGDGRVPIFSHGPQTRRRWLCIAYAFPPINRSGTQRTLGFVRHLDRLGWDASVLTVQPQGELVDASLMQRVPQSTEVFRIPWQDRVARLKKWLPLNSHSSNSDSSRPLEGMPQRPSRNRGLRSMVSEWLNTPDSRVGWVRPAVRSGVSAMYRRPIEIIYSTSPYASAHLIALQLKRRTGLPWVADFRDPWRDQPYRTRRGALAEWCDARLERLVLSAADHVVVNTIEAQTQLTRRSYGLEDRCSVIANGWDEDVASCTTPVRFGRPGEIVLVHAGQFYGPRNPEPIFRAFTELRNRRPELAARLRLVFIGPTFFRQTTLDAFAEKVGLSERVTVLGPRGHGEALSLMAGADALLLAGAGDGSPETQVPAKLYEYLSLRKPILALVAPESPSARILREARAAALICDPRDLPGLVAAFEQLSAGYVALPDAWSGVERFARARRAAELAALFAKLTSSSAPAPVGGCLAAPAVG